MTGGQIKIRSLLTSKTIFFRVEAKFIRSNGWYGDKTWDVCEIMADNNKTNGKRLNCFLSILDLKGCPIKEVSEETKFNGYE